MLFVSHNLIYYFFVVFSTAFIYEVLIPTITRAFFIKSACGGMCKYDHHFSFLSKSRCFSGYALGLGYKLLTRRLTLPFSPCRCSVFRGG